MKMSKMLKKVLADFELEVYLCPNYHAYICHSATAVLSVENAYKVKQLLAERMGVCKAEIGEYGLQDWLRENTDNYYEMYNNLPSEIFRAKVNETRIAWLKSLIAEFEAKGD